MSKQDSSINHIIEQGKNRLIVITSLYVLLFIMFAIRLIDLSVIQSGNEPSLKAAPSENILLFSRANIIDRHGKLLATNIKLASAYADATEIINPTETAQELKNIFPELKIETLQKKFSSRKKFTWVKRNITPQQQNEILKKGIPGIYFQTEEARFYPYGHLAGHVLGLTNLDNQGISGVEKYYDHQLTNQWRDLQLTLDIDIQYIVRKTLIETIEKFSAKGGISIVMDVNNAEIISMVSLPDFDPNAKIQQLGTEYFSQATAGIYEMGSVMKIINTAMTLDSGKLDIFDGFDTKKPFIHSGFRIRDFKPKDRFLTIPEIFQYSSNIGSAQMALTVGREHQKAFFKDIGFLDKPKLPILEIGRPLYPKHWADIHTVTMSYGHGIAITPIQLVHAISATINGGILHPLSLVKNTQYYPFNNGKAKSIISKTTSDMMHRLLRLVVTDGTGSKSESKGYFIGGKTGSAEKAQGGGYNRKANYSSFIAAFPVYDPQFVILVMIDEPQGIKETYGYATGGWVSAPAAKMIIEKIAQIYKIPPVDPSDHAIQTKLKLPEKTN